MIETGDNGRSRESGVGRRENPSSLSVWSFLTEKITQTLIFRCIFLRPSQGGLSCGYLYLR